MEKALAGVYEWWKKQSRGQKVEHAVVAAVVYAALRRAHSAGLKKTVGSFVNRFLSVVPGAKTAVLNEIEKEVDKSVREMIKSTPQSRKVPQVFKIPATGVSRKQVLTWARMLKSLNVDAENGRCFAYVYSTGEKKKKSPGALAIPDDLSYDQLLKEVYFLYTKDNALNPVVFGALLRMENEVISMARDLLGGSSSVVGTMTSGGTESILMAMKAYRDKARTERGITEPEIVLPVSAHAAFEKGAHYFGIKNIHVPMKDDMSVDMKAMRRAITKNTVALVVSAPQYPHGVMDPVAEAGRLAQEHKLPLHVDACVGGFMLPWVRSLGYDVPAFDFSVPGVTSISADIHKYGFALKGASVVLYRSEEYRKYQIFSYGTWPGGLFASPSMLGTRNGGIVAGAWAALLANGADGYRALAEKMMNTSKYLQREINSIDGLEIISKPVMTCISFRATADFNIFAVADVLEDDFGWTIERQMSPDCIHMSIMPPHFKIKEDFASNLQAAVKKVRSSPDLKSKGSAAMYGMVAKIPDDCIVDDFLNIFMRKLFTPPVEPSK